MRSAQDALTKTDQVPYDNIIKPEFYMVGPGDVLSFQKLDAASLEEYLVVSPENSVAIPRIGLVSLLGKTLAQARDTIIAIQKVRTPNIPCYVGLKRPRSVFVTVRGNVLNPGTYTLSATMRVSSLIKLAMQPKATADEKVFAASARIFGQTTQATRDRNIVSPPSGVLPPYAMRNVIVINSTGTMTQCDFDKATAMNYTHLDPYLREGDDVYVPADNQLGETISISGAVLRPTTTVWKQGDSLSFLLKLGGIATCENPRVRVVSGGTTKEVRTDKSLSIGAPSDCALQPGDAVFIDDATPVSGIKSQRTGIVRVIGEVVNPGVYGIEEHQTKLTDVIEKAGGVTTEAYLPLGYIVRRELTNDVLLQNESLERVKKLQYTNLILEDTMRFMIDMIARRPIVSAEFTKALSDKSSNDNVKLRDGDVIVVPKNPKQVYVFGQVKKAGYIEFVPNRTMKEYIALAGGMTENADEGRERIIKGRNGVWLNDKETIVESGDQIYVPHPPDEPLGTQLARYASYTGAISGIVGLLFSIYNIIAIIQRP